MPEGYHRQAELLFCRSRNVTERLFYGHYGHITDITDDAAGRYGCCPGSHRPFFVRPVRHVGWVRQERLCETIEESVVLSY